jgi:imidazole glycerol-phosphate synthase subunit HisF
MSMQFRPRVIPCLLLSNGGLVKTIKFSAPRYVGDPINVIRIFNDKEVDELTVLDIAATRHGREPAFEMIAELASECFMPMSYGGGITTLQQIERILKLGVEKVCLNAAAISNPNLITHAARVFGSQSIVASIDVRRSMFGKYRVYTHSGTKATSFQPVQLGQQVESLGAGEILLTAIDREGTMTGYDIELIRAVASVVSIPVIASGGAVSTKDFGAAVADGRASAVAAGSMFVFHGKHRAVLISYPSESELASLLESTDLQPAAAN